MATDSVLREQFLQAFPCTVCLSACQHSCLFFCMPTILYIILLLPTFLNNSLLASLSLGLQNYLYVSFLQTRSLCHLRFVSFCMSPCLPTALYSVHISLSAMCISVLYLFTCKLSTALKVHKIENFFDSDFGICVISLLVFVSPRADLKVINS